jgi:hypothetical protein
VTADVRAFYLDGKSSRKEAESMQRERERKSERAKERTERVIETADVTGRRLHAGWDVGAQLRSSVAVRLARREWRLAKRRRPAPPSLSSRADAPPLAALPAAAASAPASAAHHTALQ